MIKTPSIHFVIFILAGIAVFAYFLQTLLFLSPDVGYLLQATKQLLSGGTYAENFFETNPPMILYLYSPVYLLAKWTTLSIIPALRLYVLILSVFSCCLCLTILKKIIKPNDKIVYYFLFAALVYVLFLLPMYAFAQREHLLMILTLPYLFSAAAALENKPLSPLLSVIVGIWAGLGFALKPFFLVPLILVECYFIITKRNLFGWIRIESLTILSVLMIYLSAVFLFHADYIHIVLPIVMQFYFVGAEQSWELIFSFPTVIYCFCGLVVYFLFYSLNQYRTLSTLMLLALIGMIAAFIIPQSAWFYHCLPAISLVCLLLALYLGQGISALNKTGNLSIANMLAAMGLGIIIFFIPLQQNYRMLVEGIQYKKNAPQNEFVAYIHSIPGQHPVYCFSASGTSDCFPYFYQVSDTYGGRFPFFWWYLGLQKLENKLPADLMRRYKDFLIGRVAEDLVRYPTAVIVVNTYQLKKGDKTNIHLIDDFLGNERFREVWKGYALVGAVNQYQIYQRVR